MIISLGYRVLRDGSCKAWSIKNGSARADLPLKTNKEWFVCCRVTLTLHWEKMRREGYDLVIDNPAFAAFRAVRMDYMVIGKLPYVLSFTLVSQVDEMMLTQPG